VRVDDESPVMDLSWAYPHADWSCWNKFHNFYLQKGMWLSCTGLVSEEKKRLEFFQRLTSSLLNWMRNEATGIEDHRWGERPLLDD
jgi:hypothetical protein